MIDKIIKKLSVDDKRDIQELKRWQKLKDYLLDFNYDEMMADELIDILLGDE